MVCSGWVACRWRPCAGDDGIRFLLVSGKPLQEPVAWYGPIVMNTQEQLRDAFNELEKGTFLKTKNV
jgi:quercetin 2,3-dioxygenase